MDTILSNVDLQHAGVELGEPLRLPGEAGYHGDPVPPGANPSAAARVPLGATSAPRRRNMFARKGPAALAASSASTAAPTVPPEAVDSSSRGRRRGRLLATVAVICVTGSAAAWFYRDTLSTLSVRHLDLARLSLSIGGTVREAREAGQFVAGRIEAIGRMASTPSVAPTATPTVPASASSAPTLASQSAGRSDDPSTEVAAHWSASALADFASLQSSPGGAVSGPSEIGAPSHTAVPAPTSVPPRSAPSTDGPITVSAVTVPPTATSSAAPALATPTTTKAPAAPLSATASGAPTAEVKAVLPVEPVPSKPIAVASAAFTPGVVSASQPAAPATVAPSAVPPIQDPATLASELTASPMSKADQVKTIGLVRELGAQLRDTRAQVSEMQEALAHLSEQVATSNADIGSRLDFAEAASVLAQSAKAGAPPATRATQAGPPPAVVRPMSIRLPAKRTAPTAAPSLPVALSDRRTVKDYIVKGASPGLAALAALRPDPGEPGVLEIGVGDPVPGLGRVKSIYQRGTTWVVQTKNGLIQQ